MNFRSRSTLPHLRPANSDCRIPVEATVATISWIVGGNSARNSRICSSVQPYFFRFVLLGPSAVPLVGFLPLQYPHSSAFVKMPETRPLRSLRVHQLNRSPAF